MQTLRIVSVQVIDSTNIDVAFTGNLTSDLVASNVSIISNDTNVLNPIVQKVSVNKSTLSITCQPLTPFVAYYLQFQSYTGHRFISVNGDAIISEDGVSNRYLISGPLSSDNPVYNYLTSFLKDNIYNVEDRTTIVNKYVQSLSVILSKALYDIGQTGNENYLSFTVIDEQKTRSEGPFDRLNEESAYDILRVGRTPSSTNVSTSFAFDNFPSFPVTLQQREVTEILTPASIDEVGKFNINSLVLNLATSPVTKISSIIFTLGTVNPFFTYNIQTLGYQILDSRYDQDFASTYYQLSNNQVKLNEVILSDPNFALNNIIRVDVIYESKNLGQVINNESVTAFTTLTSSREALPPIINVFNLQHAPIVDTNNKVPTIGGISFVDPNNPGAKHPAFIQEITFRLNALPAIPGQYAIDYSTSTVYVYGSNSSNDGTGPYPPVATYLYRFTYSPEVDYVYDSDLVEIVALPHGNLVNYTGTVSFSYEEVFIPGTDYNVDLHKEELSERVENRLLALNALKTKKSPITNVFRVFNETSGEIYSINRWNDDTIYFKYNSPPSIDTLTGERATFQPITNELLFVNKTLSNTYSLRIFKILLNNNQIISSTEDSIGSSINSSAIFSDSLVFTSEKWWDTSLTEQVNINLLSTIGMYTIDYFNGIVYCAVSNTQLTDIGTVSYKINNIVPANTHLISVDDIYYRLSPVVNKAKQFSYVTFGEGSIIVDAIDRSDELYLNNNVIAPYQINNTNIGVFNNLTFVPGVTNQIKSVRGVFEHQDLLNSTAPINFANYSTFSGFNISTGVFNKQIFSNVQFDGSNYFVIIPENIPYLSANITYTFSVVRTSDSAPLWNLSGTIVLGDPLKLILPGINSPVVGDLVNISYIFMINNLSRIIVDYNKGDFFVDYTYLADELVVSYEYGDNTLDFRQNTTLSANDTYYVSYKVGALRDALVKNFGMLVNVPELSTIDVDFDRERYRDALIAALTSFVKGPTLSAIKNIAKTISHIEPEVTESVFQNWTLGSSLLTQENISTTGEFALLPAKFGHGVLLNNSNQTIKMPVNSNFRLEEGTFEEWIIPQWNGIDNDASLTFNIIKDGYSIDPLQVFLGVSEDHPSSSDFIITKQSIISGSPNFNKDGVFIYYDKDNSTSFSRWFIRVIDGYVIPAASATYSIKIISDGIMYDAKSTTSPTPAGLSIFTGTNKLNINISNTLPIDYSLTFISDYEHYLLDFGKDLKHSRLSLFKDVGGYLNFRVIDKNGITYRLSADVSAWKMNDTHFIAASWKLNNINSRDELHLFIDGLEVPNIIKYGQKLQPYLHEKFRTIDPEEIVGFTPRDVVGTNDLRTTAGSNTVSSSINFSGYNIQAGDTIYIDEVGFNPSGYTISIVSGQVLTLSSSMPLSITGGHFSVNRLQFTVSSNIDIAPNVIVTTIPALVSGSDLSGTISTNSVNSPLVNFITSGVKPGYSIRIDSISTNKIYTILTVSAHTLTLSDALSSTIVNSNFYVYSNIESELSGVRALRPDYSISKDVNFNNILTISNNVLTNNLILIKTLGLGFREVEHDYYVWGDGYENILRTRMDPPISLDEVDITKTILPITAIGASNSTLTLGVYYSNNLTCYQPTNSIVGRTFSATISGNNADFSTPVQVAINGMVGVTPTSEILIFNNYGTQDFTNYYTQINFITVVAKPISLTKTALAVSVSEKYPITHSEFGSFAPVIRYSYPMHVGYTLYNDGYNIVRDDNKLFSQLDVDGYLFIGSPGPVAGYYKIIGISNDRHELFLASTPTSVAFPLLSFTGGIYQVLNITEYRSGLQNGLFTFEQADEPGQAYLLRAGPYHLEYNSYLSLKIDSLNSQAYIGSSILGDAQVNAIIDHIKVYTSMLSDTRVGEVTLGSQRSVTRDFNSLHAPVKDLNTSVLIDFNSFPFINSADYYKHEHNIKNYFLSSNVVNDSFGHSIALTDKPLIISNDGILDTKKEGTIEFWLNPMFDTANDPHNRFYFDAYGAVIEEAVSIDSVSVKLSKPISSILSVKLKGGDPRIDYFAGGKVEIDTQNAMAEQTVSISSTVVVTKEPILQIISVKVVGDFSEKDYFATGTIGTDQKTIYLGMSLPSPTTSVVITYQSTISGNKKLNTQIIRLNKKLPGQKTRVLITYLPKGLQGDRISIFKDTAGYINLAVAASGIDYVIRAPTRWTRDTWHRVKASYRFNSSSDELRLFLDGYDYSDVKFNSGITFGSFPLVFGISEPGGSDGYTMGLIKFKDPINELFIGTQFNGQDPIFSLIDNLRISNIFRPTYAPYGEPIDVNYNSNLNIVFPVVSDLYTTYLMDFIDDTVRNQDFAALKNRITGNFDFSINILDSFDIVSSSPKVQQILEKLIKILKPASSRVFISYS